VTFLPIVDRELRVASRKCSTFWLRIIAALIALVICGGFFLLTLTPFSGRGQMGGPLFAVLTWLGLAGALAAGLFFTSDCLSEEKREGTLGFLFLTDLRGYDVVLGKLLATSLRSFFALLAIFPILAMTLLMGGVTGPQLWKTVLALANALFCSLSAGLLVSALSRDSQRALGVTLFVLLLLVFGGPITDGTIAAINNRGFKPVFSLASPGYIFLAAGRGLGPIFWQGLLTTQLVAWGVLALACLLVPRTWQQRRTKEGASPGSLAYAWKYGGEKRRVKLREGLLGRNPMLWLACRERWQSSLTWTLIILLALLVGAAAVASDALGLPEQVWMMWIYVGGAFGMLMYLGTASQACRFFLEARRNGLLELLLAAPLNGIEIVQGHWRALLRLFGLPIALWLCLEFVVGVFSPSSSWRMMAAGTSGEVNELLTLVVVVAGVVVKAANLIALCWFGMWMGMTSKNANLATLKTLMFVQVIPWFVISFASSMGVGLLLIPLMTKGGGTPSNAFTSWFALLFTVVPLGLALTKDVFFVVLTRRKLYHGFRDMAVRAVVPVRLAGSPAPLQRVAEPQVIPVKRGNDEIPAFLRS